MGNKIKKKCPGDCSACTLPDEIPNFDWHGCALHQIFQQVIRLNNAVADIRGQVNELSSCQAKEHVFIEQYNSDDHETSNQELLPE